MLYKFPLESRRGVVSVLHYSDEGSVDISIRLNTFDMLGIEDEIAKQFQIVLMFVRDYLKVRKIRCLKNTQHNKEAIILQEVQNNLCQQMSSLDMVMLEKDGNIEWEVV
jgi:hypothetical protein